MAGTPSLADVTLIASDHTRVPASRTVLAAHSAVFRAMWASPSTWAEGGGGDVNVSDVSGSTLKALVAYCHGALPALPPSLPSLLALFEAADKYDVAGLVAETVAGAAARAGPADVAALLAAADRRACAPLAAVCDDVAAAGLGGLLKEASFAALCVSEPHAALGLVRRAAARLGVPGCDDEDDEDDEEEAGEACFASTEEEDERAASDEAAAEAPPPPDAAPAASPPPATPARAARPPPSADPPTPDIALALAAEE